MKQKDKAEEVIVKTKRIRSSSPLRRKWQSALYADNRRNHPRGAMDLRTLVLVFSSEFLSGRMELKASISLMIRNRIAEIQEVLGRQLDEIIHHPEFQHLESSWRGLRFFISGIHVSRRLVVKVLNAGKLELLKDFEKSVQFDRSTLFKLVYEKEYGTFGGAPFSFLVGDYEFSRTPRDLHTLEYISKVASAAHSPFISGVHPGLLDMSNFVELGRLKNIDRLFSSKELVKWRSFRNSEDSRYITLVLPRILLRLPYGSSANRVSPGPIYYEESVGEESAERYLWGNPAYALAQRICESFEKYGWTARFLGIDGDSPGKIRGLPVATFDALPIPKMSTSVYILSSMDKDLSCQGIVSLCHCRMTRYPAFFSAQTVHKQKLYMKKETNANERLSAMLPHILSASRFAHYLKAIMRDKIGSFTDSREVEVFLNNWLSRYILTQANVSAEQKALHPLKEGRVKVFEDSGRPGRFKILAHIQPHYQLEALNASIRMVSALPAMGE